MRFNFKLILNILGILLIFNGIFMLLCLPFSIYYREAWWHLAASGGITALVGGIMTVSTRKNTNKELKKKDGYLIVTLGWLIMSFFGTIPYLLSGSIPDLTNAFFETISGYTTTGASIINNIEGVPKGILFWRSLTQWIGGMGIIVLAVAILPILGIGGMQLFVAEAPGISPDKMKPRIKEVAKRLWFMYLGLTIAETILLTLGGMTFYDAINHSLTTMATGGFSTKNASVAYYESAYIQYVIIVFMFLAGTNFTITYFGLKGKFRKAWDNEEFRNYFFITLILSISISFFVFSSKWESFEKSFRDSLFQVVSVITTTGFVTADYTAWAPFLTIIFFLLMFMGASAGSTAGGIKVVRHTLLFKNSFLEMKRQLHPSAIIPVRLNGIAVSRDITYNVLAFIMIYLLVYGVGVFLLSFTGEEFDTALGAVATCLGNIGPGLGAVGPVNNFHDITGFGKWLLSFLMLLGRLELFTVLMLFNKNFWQKV
ncbi:TrkH family potassium uptake protein [Fulvivirga sediminis]|uniref:TrkH family potassium uptake protein n=1 Tax=Fulvivirga sediminis TaxID=2803949 RepID=A0A937F5D0_9BACT|nr:TrkH family potassium uptake protein [Fulvivirga sediminis]MBL3654959.1 TrkH family potassium uptake protein [Fulvivirga sediminis]